MHAIVGDATPSIPLAEHPRRSLDDPRLFSRYLASFGDRMAWEPCVRPR